MILVDCVVLGTATVSLAFLRLIILFVHHALTLAGCLLSIVYRSRFVRLLRSLWRWSFHKLTLSLRVVAIPITIATGVALIIGFTFGLILAQVAVVLEVFPSKRRERENDKWEEVWRVQLDQASASYTPSSYATTREVSEEPNAVHDEQRWAASETPSLTASSDEWETAEDSEYDMDAVRDSKSRTESPIPARPPLLPTSGPMGVEFYARFRPSAEGSMLEDDADDDGYITPPTQHAIRPRGISSPLSSPSTSPHGRSISRIHSLTSIYPPIYEEDES